MTEPRRVFLAGGSGFLGRLLATDLAARGWEVVILSRTPPDRGAGSTRFERWDGVTPGSWANQLDGAAALVNLTGRSVNCLYDAANRAEIVESRVRSVQAIAAAIGACDRPPRVWIQAGSLAIYGAPGDALCDESAPHGEGFSASVCEQWESALRVAQVPQTRKVLLRIGLVLGPGGGVLQPLVTLTRRFVGGTVASGRQHLSWIHHEDFTRIVRWCVENESVQGVYNATGLASSSNAEFMWSLRRVLGRPWAPPTPAWLVRIGARWLMRAEPELALTGRRGFPLRLVREGFAFEHNDLTAALRSVVWLERPSDGEGHRSEPTA